MKKGIHPEYRPVVFRDGSADFAILTRSTIETERTIEWEDGNTYPLVELTSRARATPSTRAGSASWTPAARCSGSRTGARPARTGSRARP